jgi:hypothetical protein
MPARGHSTLPDFDRAVGGLPTNAVPSLDDAVGSGLITSEEGALYGYLDKTSEGFESLFRVPQSVSAGAIALAIAVAAVGGWIAIRKLLQIIRGQVADRVIREAISQHRAEEYRREAYHHARMLTPEERGLKPEPRGQGSGPIEKSAAPLRAFAPRAFWTSERVLFAAIVGLVVVSAIIALCIHLQGG